MNYRHVYHAGNFADVVKHIAMVAVLLHLRRKEKPYCVIDTHAGRGLYDLRSGDALRTGEAAHGIGRLADLEMSDGAPQALAAYREIVARVGESLYPGSPLIAAYLLRACDRLVAIERQPEEAEALRRNLASFRNARQVTADGYERLVALLPPPERRALVVIDPPFEAADEFSRVAAALRVALKRFSTGIYLVWYPIKSSGAETALAGEIAAAGAEKLLRISVDVGRTAIDLDDAKDRLTAAGLLIVNPPYQLDQEMRTIAQILAPRLGRDGDARFAIETL